MQVPNSILCVGQFPPDPQGHGGSQRAWHLLNALAAIAPVDYVYIYPPSSIESQNPDLRDAKKLCRSMTRIPIPEWDKTSCKWPAIPGTIGRWIDLLRIGSLEAPRLPTSALAAIGAALPVRQPGVVFAERLPAAVITDQLIVGGHLRTKRRVADFDDILSRYLTRELATVHRPDLVMLKRLQIARSRRFEREVGQSWAATGVCSSGDVKVLAAEIPGINAIRIPNVVQHSRLPTPQNERFSLLFVGNLNFSPNVHGLHTFLDEAWPQIRAANQEIAMQVVGFNPPPTLAKRLAAQSIKLAANVPSLTPYYQSASAVIAPISFGGGTRIKILEAMAMGRPVVSTSIGAEGLEVVSGEHLLIADTMPEFADAILRLAASPALSVELVTQGRALQQANYSPAAMTQAVRTAVLGTTSSLADI